MSKDNSFWGGLSNSFSSFADSVSDGFSDFFSVDKTISTDSMTKPDDVIKTKSALSSLGNYDVPDFGLTDVPDIGMINGLKNFQADNGLKVDGIMKPGGPTENALGQTLAHQGITNTNLMETAKAQAPKTIGDLPEDTTVSATSSFKDNSVKVQQPNLEKHKSLKVDPNTGMVQKKTPTPKPKKDMSKVWDDFYKQKEKKAKTAVIPQGDTVDKRIRSIMDDERYWKKREQPITDHVVKQFEKAYPGETQFDETGKMIQPKAVIQPDEVEPFDPDGELGVQSKPTGAKARYERRKAMKDNSEGSETLADKAEEFANDAIDMVGNGLSRLNPISSANAGTPEADTLETGVSPKAERPNKNAEVKETTSSNDLLKNFPDIDLSFIHKKEGNVSEIYVPKDNNGKVIGKSGATIGAGVDIGQMNAEDLQNLVDKHGLKQSIVDKLKPYLGLKKQDALQKIAEETKRNGTVLKLSEDEIKNLNFAKYDHTFMTLQQLYDKDSKIKFKDLPKQAQTVIASVAINHGPGLKEATPKFWSYVTQQNWKQTFAELNDFKEKVQVLNDRRKDEAEYMKDLVPAYFSLSEIPKKPDVPARPKINPNN